MKRPWSGTALEGDVVSIFPLILLVGGPSYQFFFPFRFVAERAHADLNALIRHGPRPVGSKENEELVFNFLKTELTKIQNSTNKIHSVTISDQLISGSFQISQRPVGYVSFYHNVQNIIVRLSSNFKKSNSSAVLVNCHFDSVPGSPGVQASVSCLSYFICKQMSGMLKCVFHFVSHFFF